MIVEYRACGEHRSVFKGGHAVARLSVRLRSDLGLWIVGRGGPVFQLGGKEIEGEAIGGASASDICLHKINSEM